MLDFDLANLYGVTTKALNQAMKRNLQRFPSDFCFQLTKELEIRYNKQFSDIYDVLTAMQEDKKLMDDFANRERIGFKINK